MPATQDTTHEKPATGVFAIFLRYKDFLLDPGTLFTLASGLLLIIATIVHPAGLFSETGMSGNGKYLYLAAALVGSSYIWWSAIQGIRERDFTADIPVSIATIAAILIGQYSAAAVVAVLLLLGGLLEDFVAARAGQALEALAKLLPDRYGRSYRNCRSGPAIRRFNQTASSAGHLPQGYPDDKAERSIFPGRAFDRHPAYHTRNIIPGDRGSVTRAIVDTGDNQFGQINRLRT